MGFINIKHCQLPAAFKQHVLDIIKATYGHFGRKMKHYIGFNLGYKPDYKGAVWINVFEEHDCDPGNFMAIMFGGGMQQRCVYSIATNNRTVKMKLCNDEYVNLPASITYDQLEQVRLFVHEGEQWRQQYGQGITGPLVQSRFSVMDDLFGYADPFEMYADCGFLWGQGDEEDEGEEEDEDYGDRDGSWERKWEYDWEHQNEEEEEEASEDDNDADESEEGDEEEEDGGGEREVDAEEGQEEVAQGCGALDYGISVDAKLYPPARRLPTSAAGNARKRLRVQ